MQIVTLNQLIENWFRFKEPITRQEIDDLDWDELMLALEISCPEAEGKNIVITDFDSHTWSNIAVSFSLVE